VDRLSSALSAFFAIFAPSSGERWTRSKQVRAMIRSTPGAFVMFEWLENEIRDVKTPCFHIVDGPADDQLRDAIERSPLALPDSYKAFVLVFGNAKLYRQPRNGSYLVGVLAGPREATLPNGQMDYLIGHFDSARAYVRPPKGDWQGGELPILEWHGGHQQKIADCFEAWLRMRCAKARKSYGKKGWEKILEGPEPFSPEELAILDARRRFSWRLVGFAPDGDMLLEIRNGSDRSPPRLSVGARSKDDKLHGGLHVDVSGLAPGETRTFKLNCYRQFYPPDQMELFSRPDPNPWERESYSEFGTW
jgi:hypothetical protein